MEENTVLTLLARNLTELTREQALRCAVEKVIARVRLLAKPQVLSGGITLLPHISTEKANIIIEWASGLIGIQVEPVEAMKRAPAWADLPLFQGTNP